MIRDLINIRDAQAIIDHFGTEFDSHKFIEVFADQHPNEYSAILIRYTEDADRKANSLIARFLSANQRELQITKVKNRKSKSGNVHENQTSCALWRKNL